MGNFFINIYNWFKNHTKSFYAILLICVGILAAMASQVKFQENITNFFNGANKNKNEIFKNIRAKDKIIVMLSGEDPDEIIEAAEVFEKEVEPLIDKNLVSSIVAGADEETIGRYISFVYNYLPIFLTDDDYSRLESEINSKAITEAVDRVYNLLTSPSGMFVGDVVMQDPLNIGTHLLQGLEKFSPSVRYEIYNGRIFTKDLSTMLMFIEPSYGMGDTKRNDELVSKLEEAKISAESNGVQIDCTGGPFVAVYNARQIKKDTAITISIALIIILLVIVMSFRNKWSIPFIVLPSAFGALFALAMVWLIQGEISSIAIGAGTVVLGISLSYSIHVVSHLNYISSPEKILEELALPLTIGCLTTIGAFAALMFTSSSLLKDLGLFSVFTLSGTIIFCLVFLPQFLRGFKASTKSRLLKRIEQAVGYRFDKNKWVVVAIVVATIVSLFFYTDVEFDGNIANINYMPQHVKEAEERSAEIFGEDNNDIYIVTGSKDLNSTITEYYKLQSLLGQYHESGEINDFVSVADYVVPPAEQEKRIEKWNGFWDKNKEKTLSLLSDISGKKGFKDNTFIKFEKILNKDYKICNYTDSEIGDLPVISEWINSSDKAVSLLCRMAIDKSNKPVVYDKISEFENTVVVDREYFSSIMLRTTIDDFNYILFVSSLIVFIGLFLSYGRIELTLLTFLPMAVSWVIILGLMAIFRIKFNVVNIILATFIFGIGDDFSIFIMDGLQQEYKNGKKLLEAHKTAIFFSAFTAVVGMGVLIFARHPALKSIAVIAVLGLSVVVLVSYTIQPILFRLLVTSHTRRGEFPYTIGSIIKTAFYFLFFLLGCLFLQFFMLCLLPLPIKRSKKKEAVHNMIYRVSRAFLKTAITVKIVRINQFNEKYDRPAVIIANHQSFIDILLLLSITPKIVMITKGWVWNSPFFGGFVRYADFHYSDEGYEALTAKLREKVDKGYSVVIFPEGTRSPDCSIRRFHKGAFYIAQALRMDILPIIIYGAGHVSAKNQGFHIKSGIIATKTMQRIKFGDTSFGTTYQEQSKKFHKWYIEQYRIFNDELGRADNSYFREALIKNYIYKGPVLEWYMRLKCRIDGYYDFWDRLIPRNAVVTDIGCGYGQLSFMLGILSPARHILGVDYDEEKIEIAGHSFLAKRPNIGFKCEDMRHCEIPQSDAILFNDSLHYVDPSTQYEVISHAVASLNPNGLIIVRDGNAGEKHKHDKTIRTEVWSTEILKFNKTSEPLNFVNAEWMEQVAKALNLNIKIRQCDRKSSQTLYILSRNAK